MAMSRGCGACVVRTLDEHQIISGRVGHPGRLFFLIAITISGRIRPIRHPGVSSTKAREVIDEILWLSPTELGVLGQLQWCKYVRLFIVKRWRR